MGKVKKYNPTVKLVVGLLYQDEAIFIKAKTQLKRKFGNFDFESQALDFKYTDYYTPEMGDNLKRRFMSFQKLVPIGDLFRIKLYTNRLEMKFLKGKSRCINIDPGYLDLAKLVLASTKDYAHRIYFGKGIFAEITLTYRGHSFAPNDWSYPDFRTQGYLDIFNQIRKLYAS